MRTPAETIAKNLETANRDVAGCRQLLADRVTEGRRAEDLTTALNGLAQAEGAQRLWARLNQAVENPSRGEEFNETVALRLVAGMLAQGADDSWSGRGNDVNRAHFDGIRSAAQKVEWIF